MERHLEFSANAIRKIHIADHLLSISCSNVHNTRILISAIENIFLAMSYSMGALLHYEKKNKGIGVFEDNFEAKYALFRQHAVKKYGFDMSYLDLMVELKGIILKHQKSAVEIVKNNELIIFDDDYIQKRIGPNDIREYIFKSRDFVSRVDSILKSRDDSLQ